MTGLLPLALLSISSTALAANPLTVAGTCDGGGTYSFTVELDTATEVFNDGTFARWDLSPVSFDLCATSRTVVIIVVQNDNFVCSGEVDAVYFLSVSTLDWWVYLEDTTQTAFGIAELPSTQTRSHFDVGGVAPNAFDCQGLGGTVDTFQLGGAAPGVTLLDRADDARAYGGDAFTDLNGGTPRLGTATQMEAQLLEPVTRLENTGCTLAGHLGGAYNNASAMAAEDDGGVLVAPTLVRRSKQFTATLTSGAVVEGNYNRNRQSFGFRDDGGFYVGQFVQTRGVRGTFYGVTGACPAGTDYETVLGGWYRAPFPTL